MKKIFMCLLMALLTFTPGCQKDKDTPNEYNVIPLPNRMTPQKGRFELNDRVVVNTEDCIPEVKSIADNMVAQIKKTSGIKLSDGKNTQEESSINFITERRIQSEGYQLIVTPNDITIMASEPNGFFYGLQTLYQLLPPEIYGKDKTEDAEWSVPCVEIEDSPRFAYRGLMLDVCRHYAPVEYIYKFIDQLAMNKMNVFHWHLTDDQGWRIEIKKYPKLTEIGSKRNETLTDYYFANYPFIYDGKEYGGYYTQEQIKDIVDYAAQRYITVLPEIELPGHALAALASYPELSCGLDSTYEVAQKWGIFEQVFCPKENTFIFLENVMDEVIDLFPSPYIHIGGDECPKTAWEKCPHCQKLIKELRLTDDVIPNEIDGKKHSKEEKLQSYFVGRMEKYLNEKGRNIIGWDEILEGGLAPNATVMSWRGVEGGINAAKAGHDVIMTPGNYCYLDKYQEDPNIAPVTIGGYNTLKQTYNYNPVKDDADSLLQVHIMGIQGNSWSEYMPTLDIRDYQIFPRAIAIAETGWTQNKNKNWNNFSQRMVEEFKRLDIMGIKACRNFFDVNFNTHVDKGILKIFMNTYHPDAIIHYTTDGSEPNSQSTVYNKPLALTGETHIRAAAFINEDMIGKVSDKTFYGNLISGKPYAVVPASNTYFAGDIIDKNDKWGADKTTLGLTNGKRGYDNSYMPWVAFYLNDKENTNVEFTVKLDRLTEISKVILGSLDNPAMSIRSAKGAIVETSEDGHNYLEVANEAFFNNIPENGRHSFTNTISFAPTQALYIKIIIKNGGIIKNGIDCRQAPDRPNEYPANLFIDEIEVY